jgi:putative spermidine/putrescine transport system substrate-binding protein
MSSHLRRRDVLAAGAAAGTLALPLAKAWSQTKPTLAGVTWGGPWITAWKQLVAEQNAVDVDWTLHEAATSAIVAKIKATWPKPQFDFVNASAPTLIAMMREGWVEPLQHAIPNLAHLPADLFVKSPEGDVVAIPVDITTVFWAYDEHAVGMKIEKPDDLLSPKLRDKVMLNWPSIGSGAQLTSLARARGGDEHNIQPGFDFVKDLIKAKNVARLVKTDVEVVNAFTTGEVAIGVINMGNYHEIRKHVDLTPLDKVPDSPCFKSFFGYEGVAVLKREGDHKPVMDFLNSCLEPGPNSEYSAAIGALPANLQGTASPELAPLQLSADEIKRFAVFPDVPYISAQISEWNRKWELEIGPLL